MRRDRELADGRGIAQAEIEPLRADRRDHMRGFADERDAVAPRNARGLDAEREQRRGRARPSILPRIECARRSISAASAASSSAASCVRLGRIQHADKARTQAGQRHQRERAVRGVEFGRDVVVRPRMAEIERERGLRIVVPLGLDAGGRAAERLRPSAPTTSARRDRLAVVEP